MESGFTPTPKSVSVPGETEDNGGSLWAIGAWLSAALDDPNVCAAMKRDIREWFAAGGCRAAPVRRAGIDNPQYSSGIVVKPPATEYGVEMSEPVTSAAPDWTLGHEAPGKLSELQRDYILAGASFISGQPLPFNDLMIPYLGRTSFLGLVKRGFYSTRPDHRAFYYLTAKGYRAARAILAISGRAGHYRIVEIDAYMTSTAVEGPSVGTSNASEPKNTPANGDSQ